MQAGRLLALLLMAGGHGDRPVRLVGHSMGARVVFYALLELSLHNCKGDPRRAILRFEHVHRSESVTATSPGSFVRSKGLLAIAVM